MPSFYLQPEDYAAYGVENTTAQQVSQASTIINGFLQRPEGLLWIPDGNNLPCYMAGVMPLFTLTASKAITPGSNIVVNIEGSTAAVQIGSVLILDRDDPQLTEACVVTAVSNNTITLSSVNFKHAANTTLDSGLTIVEERTLPEGRPLTLLSRSPVARLLNGQGRYGYSRRSATFNSPNEFNLLATINKFGGPPLWENWEVTQASIDTNMGELWAPTGILLAYYTEIRVSYIAGWRYENLPTAIKQACANVIRAANDNPISGSISSFAAGDYKATKFCDTLIDGDAKEMLTPFKARVFA